MGEKSKPRGVKLGIARSEQGGLGLDEDVVMDKPIKSANKSNTTTTTATTTVAVVKTCNEVCSTKGCNSKGCANEKNLAEPKSLVQQKAAKAELTATLASKNGTVILPPKPRVEIPEKIPKGGEVKTTVSHPVAIREEIRDLPPFDPAYAEQYMVYAQQFSAYAQQFALYAQYCAQQGAIDQAKKQQEAAAASREEEFQKAHRKALKKGRPLPEKPGTQGKPLMITPYRHNWIISGAADGQEDTGPAGKTEEIGWWETLKNETYRLFWADTRGCGSLNIQNEKDKKQTGSS